MLICEFCKNPISLILRSIHWNRVFEVDILEENFFEGWIERSTVFPPTEDTFQEILYCPVCEGVFTEEVLNRMIKQAYERSEPRVKLKTSNYSE